MSSSDDRSAPRCPVCSKPRALAYKPFCSKRCADVDLSRWLGGRYAIPAQEEDEGDGASSDRPDPPPIRH
jgi:hypothetical protein